ncbi:MAG TPA: HD domain-containing phosphohydrolase [Longimicrobiales bacterium]|nr:HD domain-containing phosphohydrolase [Longimicrobiales bacterium]
MEPLSTDTSPQAVRTRTLLFSHSTRARHWLKLWLEREGADVRVATDPAAAVALAGRAELDVVLMDPDLRDPSDVMLLDELRNRYRDLPVILLSPPPEALLVGEPQDVPEDPYLMHLAELVRTAGRLRQDAERLETGPAVEGDAMVQTLALQGARSLVQAMEAKGVFARGGSQQVAEYAAILAETVGGLDVDQVRVSAELHDVGRLGVPTVIWNKAGPLDAREAEQVRRHPMLGLRLLKPLLDDADVLAGIVWHHERWDGQGYPDGLHGDDIPAIARVIGVAEALWALTTDRPYRPALGWEKALAELQHGRGTQFAPEVIDALMGAEDRLRQCYLDLLEAAGQMA